MRIRLHKKGTEYMPVFLVLVTLILLIYASYALYDKINEVRPIGDTQYKLLNTYDSGEKIQYYIDESARYSGYAALSTLADKGGIFESECGNYFGSTLLTNQTDNCIPEDKDVSDDFQLYFDIVFNNYLSDYDLYRMPYANFFYYTEQKTKLTVQGFAMSELIIPIPATIKRGEATDLVSFQAPYVVPKNAEEKLKKIIETYGDKIKTESENYLVNENLITAVIAQESGGNPLAVSPTGCTGLTQFCIKTAEDFKSIFGYVKQCTCNCGSACDIQKLQLCSCDLNDGRLDGNKSIKATAAYFKRLKEMFKDYTSGTEFAIASYNGGAGVIQNAIKATGKSDPKWRDVANQLQMNPYLITYFDSYNDKRDKVKQIDDYVKAVMGYRVKYEEMKAGNKEPSPIQIAEPEQKTHDCCVCKPECGVVCSVQTISEAQSCGPYATGQGVNCNMAYCVPKQEDIPTIGEYLLYPAFETRFNYDISIYKKIFSSIEELNSKYDSAMNKKEFILQLEKDPKTVIIDDLEWKADCEENKSQKIFYSFAEQYYDCAYSIDTNCYCEIYIPQDMQDTIILITGDDENTSLIYKDRKEMVKGIIPARTGFPTLSFQQIGSKELSFKKESDTEFSLGIKGAGEGLLFSKNYDTQSSSEPFLMFKGEKELAFIDPSLSGTSSQYQNAHDDYLKASQHKSTYPVCRLNKDTVKLCVDTKTTIPTYNLGTRKVEDKMSVIKFAYTFRDITPPPLIEDILEVKRPLTQKEAMIRFKFNNTDGDTKEFDIFISEKDISKMDYDELEDAVARSDVKLLTIQANTVIGIKSINLENPIYPLEKLSGNNLNSLAYKFFATLADDTQPVNGFLPEKDKLYNVIDTKDYLLRLGFDNNLKYYVVVSAIDTHNNVQVIDEAKNTNILLDVKDSLPPATYPLEGFMFIPPSKIVSSKVMVSWLSMPKYNTDGDAFEPNAELKEYHIYYTKGDMPSGKVLGTPDMVVSKDKYNAELNIAGFDASSRYCFYVVPVDTNGNKQFSKDTEKLMTDTNFFMPRCASP